MIRSMQIEDLMESLSERHRRSFIRRREACGEDLEKLDSLIEQFYNLSSTLEPFDDDEDDDDDNEDEIEEVEDGEE